VRTLPGKKLKPTFFPWFINRSSVHLTATLSNLTDFDNFCTAETGKNVQNKAYIKLFIT